MKKHLIILAAVVGFTVSAFGQGQVTIANNASSLITLRNASGVDQGPIAAGSGYIFQLFAGVQGASSNSLTAVLPTTGVNAVAAGRIANQIVTVTQVLPGATATFQIRAWNSAYATYELASLAADGFVGASALFESLTSATGNPTPLPVTLAGKYASFAIQPVPEPSTIALGILGAGSLLFLRRKK